MNDRDRQRRLIKEAYDDGFNEGLKKGRREILDFLEHAYIEAPDRPDRGTPKAEAILEMARDASLHFTDKLSQEEAERLKRSGVIQR